MIINKFNLGNTMIIVDNTYYPQSDDEKEKRFQEFNKIGNEILQMKGSEKNGRPNIQSIYNTRFSFNILNILKFRFNSYLLYRYKAKIEKKKKGGKENPK